MVSEVKESNNLWTIFDLFYGHYWTIWSFRTMLHTKVQKFHVRTFFPSKREIPGYRHTQVAEIHLSTLLVKREMQQYISVHQHINTTLMGKGYWHTPQDQQAHKTQTSQYISTSIQPLWQKGKRYQHTSQDQQAHKAQTSQYISTSIQPLWQKGKGYRHTSQDLTRPAGTQDPQPANTSKWILPYVCCVLWQGSGPVLHTSTKSVPSVYLSNIHECHPFTWGDHIRRTS